ncbi:FtsX-like permease family protein [Pengzhenrongella phosphoraccumulans]|uniref:FtsX-like permease family protein n=1 Tax=Pengzhenrongella phosphoraccumulans TaxID=3114394 RepID=UPI0038901473
MRTWGAGMRAAGRIARRDALRSKGRTALVAAMIGLPVLAASTGAVLLLSGQPTSARYAQMRLGDQTRARIDSFVAPGLTQDARGGFWSSSATGTPEPPTLADYQDDLAAAIPAGGALIRTVHGNATVATADVAPTAALEIAELPTDVSAIASLAPVVDGVLPAGSGQVALSRSWATRLSLGLGDTVEVTPVLGDPITMTVTGVLANTGTGPALVATPGSLLSLPQTAATGPTWIQWYVTGPAAVTWAEVSAINEIGSVVVSRAVILDPPAEALSSTSPVGGGTLALIAAVAAMALLEVVLLIGPAFAVGTRRSERQLALIAASGGERRTLRHVVLLGAAGIGATASLAAIVAGIALAAAIRAVVLLRGSVAFPDLRIPWALPLLIVLGTAIAAAAAWIPARRAARVDVVAALAGRRPQTRTRHGVPIIGLVLFALGAAAALLGAIRSDRVLLVGGVLALEIGLIAASGGLVTLVGLLAPHAGVAGRIAMRDAARQRGRTAPAIAAVIAAIAGVVAGAVYTQSGESQREAQYTPFSAVGVVALGFTWNGASIDAIARQYDAAEQAVRAGMPVTAVHPVYVAAPSDPSEPGSLLADLPPENWCPDSLGANLSAAERRAAGNDPRCQTGRGGQVLWVQPENFNPVLVDDGTVLESLELPASATATEALRAGNVVVSSRYDLWPDGTVHLTPSSQDPVTGEAVTGKTFILPAVAVDLPASAQYSVVLPPQVLPEMGRQAQLAGLVAPTSRIPTQREQDLTARTLSTAAPAAYLNVERGFTDQQPLVLWVLLAAAVVVGLGATGLSVALAAAESRPDLATLSAVGASPTVRRRVAAAQAGVIAIGGVGLGGLTGLLLGWVLVLAERYRYDNRVDLDWQVIVPWPAIAAIVVGVPVLAIAGSYLLTRSQLPIGRRIAR